MVVKIKEYFQKTRHIKNTNKSKKYILRRERNTIYYDRILSNKKKSHNSKITYICKFIFIVTSTCMLCDYIQTHCNDRRNPFHFACRQWFSYNNPGILT